MIGGAESDVAAIVVELRLVDPHYLTARGRVDYIGIAGRDLPFRNHTLAIEGMVVWNRKISLTRDWLARVGIDPVVADRRWVVEIRMKCQSEQTALIVVRHDGDEAIGHIQV